MRSTMRKLLAVGIPFVGHELMIGRPLLAEDIYSCTAEWAVCNAEHGYFCSMQPAGAQGYWYFTCCDKTTHEESWGGVCTAAS